MDNTAIASVNPSALVTALPLLLPLGIAALFAWVVIRTESWHLLRRRIWPLTHGKGEITDTNVHHFIEEQTDLAAFRIFVGPTVRSIREARELMEWCRARDVELGTLRDCGSHFDPHTRLIKANERYLKWAGRFWGYAAMLLLGVGLASFQVMAISSPLLSIKSSGQLFLASESSVRGLWPPFRGPSLTPEGCKDPKAAAQRMPFKPEDTAVMCELLAAPELKDYLRKSLFEQRASLFALGLIAFAGMYSLGVSAHRCSNARKLRARQLNPALPASQMTLDFGNQP